MTEAIIPVPTNTFNDRYFGQRFGVRDWGVHVPRNRDIPVVELSLTRGNTHTFEFSPEEARKVAIRLIEAAYRAEKK